MDNDDRLSIRPGDVNDATSQLGELADRIRRVMDAEALNLTVVPSARDEVSARVASTLNEVHTSFSKAADRGQTQLADVVNGLRNHTEAVVAGDEAAS